MHRAMIFIDKYITNNMIIYEYTIFSKLCLFWKNLLRVSIGYSKEEV